ncbi:MAG: glycosyltransferase family 2 protein [Chrysiogenales bacterium]|nr:MAG: glycosyltransferase family 2 protein [Chrysiogenales bacterium]
MTRTHKDPVNLVSVIIPVFNGEKYLEEAIASVTRQSYRPLEIIIVDDGSTDGSADIARRHNNVTYCFQKNAGPSSALNRGVDLAGGDFFAFLDADDIWSANKLARQMECLARNPSLDVVFAHVEQFCSPELQACETSRIPDALKIVPGYCPGTMLIRRQSFCRAGHFDPRLQVGQFLAWYMKANDDGLRGRMLPEILLKRRWHTTNMGISERASRSEYARILKASLDHRRQRLRLPGTKG